MNRLTAIVGIVVLILVMVAANYFMTKSQNAVQLNPRTGQPVDQEIDANNRTPAQKAAAKAALTAPPSANNLEAASQISADSTVPGEAVVGNPDKAKSRISIGYTWDSASQVNPDALIKITNELMAFAQKNTSTTSLQVVCLDIPSADIADPRNAAVPLGVSVDGKPVAGCAGNPGEGACSPAAALAAAR